MKFFCRVKLGCRLTCCLQILHKKTTYHILYTRFSTFWSFRQNESISYWHYFWPLFLKKFLLQKYHHFSTVPVLSASRFFLQNCNSFYLQVKDQTVLKNVDLLYYFLQGSTLTRYRPIANWTFEFRSRVRIFVKMWVWSWIHNI